MTSKNTMFRFFLLSLLVASAIAFVPGAIRTVSLILGLSPLSTSRSLDL